MQLYTLLTIYIVVACYVFRHSWQRKYRFARVIFVLVTFGMMLFMLGLRREDIGNDTADYNRFFTQIGKGNITYDARIEVGFRYFARLVSLFSQSTHVFVFVCALAVFIPVFIFFTKTNDEIEYNIALFWFLGCFSFCSAARQGIAISIVLIGYLYLRKNTFRGSLIYFVCCILASSFHNAAIVMVVVPILRKWKVSTRIMISFIVVSLLLTQTSIVNWVFNRFAGDYYVNYLNVQSGWLATFFNAGIGLFALFIDNLQIAKIEGAESEKQIVSIRNSDSTLRWTALLYTVCWILSVNSGVMGRMNSYFAPFLIVYLSKSIKNSNLSLVYYYALCFALGGYNLLALIIRPEWNSFFPYFFYWQ